jgi:hypothetical protein
VTRASILTKGDATRTEEAVVDSDVGNGVTAAHGQRAPFQERRCGRCCTIRTRPSGCPCLTPASSIAWRWRARTLVKEKGKFIWKHTGTARNEAWDLETLQRAAAEMDNIGVQQAPEETTAQLPKTGGGKHPLDYRKWS